MTASSFHSASGTLAVVGGLGAAYMVLYKIALRHVDRDLIPRSALPRVRWWSDHASHVLWVSAVLAVLGLAGYVSS
ncbi:hypothetical protein [Streptomyces sp. cg40]|uniref:hypothetical protein n=1 Tax=Streptomyces sp. cg40 TaxID=3419764 RepID=UPI003D0628DC